jgi:hypothetical protein
LRVVLARRLCSLSPFLRSRPGKTRLSKARVGKVLGRVVAVVVVAVAEAVVAAAVR